MKLDTSVKGIRVYTGCFEIKWTNFKFKLQDFNAYKYVLMNINEELRS